MTAPSNGRPVAIIPAAGASTRMGGGTKALLPWGLGTLLGYQLAQLRLAGFEERIVVAGADAAGIARVAATAGAAVVVNERWQEGRASSVRAGAAAVPDDAGPILLLNVDQPRPASISAALLVAYGEQAADIVVPVHEGRRGHPVLFDGRLLSELRSVREEEQGLRAVMARHAADVREIETGTALIHLDLNTPEDYERALRLFAAEDIR